MNQTDFNVLEKFTKPRGFEFDLHEAFHKLATSQFGGSPGRGFCELIQNAIDSYPSAVPLRQRKIEIQFSATTNTLTVRDEGEGMPVERINLLATLGGTDKQGDPDKIGKFGMGFFSIFNPDLQTSMVRVKTRCGSRIVLLDFIVDEADPTRPPKLRTEVVQGGNKNWSGSEITVQFRKQGPVEVCLFEAKKFLRYFPCPVFINGETFTGTVWERAKATNATFFEDSWRHGFLERDNGKYCISVLCKYEQVLEDSIGHFSKGGHNTTGSLRDLKCPGVPYVPATFTLVNDNQLNVTVSRDSVRLDEEYFALVRAVAAAHMDELRRRLKQDPDPDLIMANQFVFAREINRVLENPKALDCSPMGQGIAELADYPIYRLAGEPQKVSLRDIWQRRTARAPVFYSPHGLNTNWLGGAFEHDFIVLPPECACMRGDDGLLDELLFQVFEDTINLDTIRQEKELIGFLVRRGIVPPELLSPKCKLIGVWEASAEEQRFLSEINEILAIPQVGRVIQQHLHLSTSNIQATLFGFVEEGVVAATGLFEENGQAYNPDTDEGASPKNQRELRLGLMRTHPLIQHLIASADPHRAFFSLTFLAHQLVSCQRMLVPGSSFQKWLMSRLGAALRNVLIDVLVPEKV